MNITDWNCFARSLGYKDERDMMEDMYANQRLPISEIANRIKVGTATISRRLSLLGVDKRSRGGANNPGRQTSKLFHFDQRVVLSLDLNRLATITRISRSLCYKYRITRIGRANGVLYFITSIGLGEVLNPFTSSLTTPPDPKPPVSEILQEPEGSR